MRNSTFYKPFKLPKNILLGCSTSSVQIEGGDTNNSWYRWAEMGKIKDNSSCIVACNHWNNIDEDINLIKSLNCKVYRLSIEWSRIESSEGSFNKDAINHYRNEIEKLLSQNIKPIVTLHHFSNPIWFEDFGGWLSSKSIDLFERYTEYISINLIDLVKDWITINEPNVYLFNGYITGDWPPGIKNNQKLYISAARNMILSHIKSYRKIHEIGYNKNISDIKVGVAHHLRVFNSKSNSFLDKFARNRVENTFQQIFITGMTEGKFIKPLGNNYPLGKGKYSDFFGINYYTRDIVSFSLSIKNNFLKIEKSFNCDTNDLGWEIYPDGLYILCKKYFEEYKLPIYITENGIADSSDKNRASFIYQHLYQIKKLLDENIPIHSYCHWSLLDNFEWLEGYSAKFGLYSFDIDTQEKKIRKSGLFYSEICKNNEIDENTISEYLTNINL